MNCVLANDLCAEFTTTIADGEDGMLESGDRLMINTQQLDDLYYSPFLYHFFFSFFLYLLIINIKPNFKLSNKKKIKKKDEREKRRREREERARFLTFSSDDGDDMIVINLWAHPFSLILSLVFPIYHLLVIF